jgi:tetratricopeptide (TPR) repeat protein
VSPEVAPDVRRVIELDGRSSLSELHQLILQSFGLPNEDDLYGFSMSGRYDDRKNLFVGPALEGQRAERALLFRLGLQAGTTFGYLRDSGAETRFTVRVVDVSEVSQALSQSRLVESVGELEVDDAESTEPQTEPAEVVTLVPLAEAFLDAHDALEPFDEQLKVLRSQLEPWEEEEELGLLSLKTTRGLPESALPLLQATAERAVCLLQAAGADLPRFLRLDEWLIERSLSQRLLDLPLDLSAAGQHEQALQVSRAVSFIDDELSRADSAIVLARAGRRSEALALLETNLSSAKDKSFVEAKAGDAHRALGDLAAAEAYYRHSLALAETEFDRSQATLRLVSCLLDAGRPEEANRLLTEERRLREAGTPVTPPAGRNDPCPCGSGKKYKKCHGAS